MADEKCYVITPKGIATLCLGYANIECTDSEFETFWVLFEHYMKKNGYIVEDES